MSNFKMPQKFREMATSSDDSSDLSMQFDNFFRESQVYLFIEHLCPILVHLFRLRRFLSMFRLVCRAEFL